MNEHRPSTPSGQNPVAALAKLLPQHIEVVPSLETLIAEALAPIVTALRERAWYERRKNICGPNVIPNGSLCSRLYF